MKLVDVADEIAAAVRILARHRHAAVILCDPAISVAGGVLLDAVVSRELLTTIFAPESTIRTGVAVIRGCRIERAGAPVSWAAVMECPAALASGVAIAIDEATSGISVVDRTARVAIVDADELTSRLRRHLPGAN